MYVPEIETNSISIQGATENGCVPIFENDSCKITYNGCTRLEGRINNNLYQCRVCTHTINVVNACQNENCLHKWHRRLEQRNINHIKELVNLDLATGI